MINPKSPNVILVVEDDRNIATLIAKYLANADYETILVHDGTQALTKMRRHVPVLVILDILLPGMDGWEICREMRKVSDVPLLMLSACSEELDRVLGFSLGADDYVIKPFSPRELVERVKAILRRARPAPIIAGGTLQFSGLALEPEKRKVTVNGVQIALTRSEYDLLHTLMNAPGRVFSRDELLDRLGEHRDTVINRVIDVHIGKLRQKIETDPSSPFYIRTIHGIGYQFVDIVDE